MLLLVHFIGKGEDKKKKKEGKNLSAVLNLGQVRKFIAHNS